MTARALITHLSKLHATDDPVLTALKVQTELNEMNEMCDNNRIVKKALKRISNYINNRVK